MKDSNNYFNNWINKKNEEELSENFTKLRPLPENVKVELDLDVSTFARKIDLAGLKSEIDKLDLAKLETTLVDLSKSSDVVKNVVVKMTICDELVKKVNAIQASNPDSLLAIYFEKLTRKLLRLKIKFFLMIIVISILLLKNLID